MDKIKLYVLTLLLFSKSLLSWPVEEFAYDKDWVYQDLWINGEVLSKGISADCPGRYEALRPLLNQFKRPFTVLDIGANNGYFCLRIANEYDATCVMIDGTDRLKKICEANSSVKRIIYLEKFIDFNDLLKLAETEHFDVVLCFHVLHHIQWEPAFPALLKLGDYVVIQTPPVNDGFVAARPTIPEIAQYVLNFPGGVQIGSFVRQRPEIKDHMILFSNHNMPRQDLPLPGISLATFYEFNGVYPTPPKKDDPSRWRVIGQDLLLESP